MTTRIPSGDDKKKSNGKSEEAGLSTALRSGRDDNKKDRAPLDLVLPFEVVNGFDNELWAQERKRLKA